MRRQLLAVFAFAFLLATFSVASETVVKGYKGVNWGTALNSVLKTLPKKKDSMSCDSKTSSLIFDRELTKALKAKSKIPGFKWGHYDDANYPYDHTKKFKILKIGDGCGFFFNDKFVGQHIRFYATSNAEIKSGLEQKYGKLVPFGEGSFLGGPRVFSFETNETLILFHEDRLKRGGDIPEVIYLSKVHEAEIAKHLSDTQRKDLDDRTKANSKKKKATQDAL